MTFLSFVASIIGSLAWPAVIVVLLWLTRPHLRGLVERLEELTLPGGARAKFAKQLDAAREQKEGIVLAEGPPSSSQEEIGLAGIEQYLALANISPEGAIMQAYKVLESVTLTFRNKIPSPLRNNLTQVIRDLHRRELLDSSWVELFDKIRNLRNLSVHAGASQRVTPGEAIEYQSLCRLLSDKLFEIFKGLPTIDE